MRRALTLLLLLAALPAAAEVQLESIVWQTRYGQRAAKAEDVTRLALPAGTALKGRLRARVKVLNRGEAVEGVLLRYSLTAQLAATGAADAAQAPTWAIAFDLDEKRVPKIGANQHFEITLDPTQALSLYLKRVAMGGYWPTALKLQVMLEPRKGAGPLQVIESTLPIGEAK